MLENLQIALQITLVGMGLVLGAIVLLWIMMAVLVKLTSRKSEKYSDSPLMTSEHDRRRKVAVATVAAALSAELTQEPHEFPLPSTAVVSPWQSVMRSNILMKRGRIR